ncbi:MAG: cation:dicarboxylase symporter family transporter [Candidatus Eremiobacteraeota bacterium]|nr:cation:dicarboxylase symporter family transporter [Candidatus Eremiobacteraeota bacterium]
MSIEQSGEASPGGGHLCEEHHEDQKKGHHKLTTWIFVGMILGVIVGLCFPKLGVALRPYGRMFITMIKAIIAPLVFSTLVVGITGAGNMKTVGRIGLKAIIYFEIATTFALIIGLAMGNLVQPGAGITLKPQEATAIPGMNLHEMEGQKQSLGEIIQHLFTPSIVESMARGDVLQIVIFTLIFSAGVLAVKEKARPIIDLCSALAEVMFKFTSFIMYFAPFGVGCAIAAAVGEHGPAILISLGKLVLTLYGSLAVFLLCVLLPVALLIRIPIKRFISAVEEPVVLAFSTTSSEAALPKAMIAMERFGVPKHIVGFVMPTGYSFNLDGTTLYLSLAALFVAQAAGHPMTLPQQIIMLLTLMITSKGVAGVPRASLVILAGTLHSFNLPVEAILIILGADEIMDMARTSVNVLGNCLATVVVARWEKNFDDRKACEFEDED